MTETAYKVEKVKVRGPAIDSTGERDLGNEPNALEEAAHVFAENTRGNVSLCHICLEMRDEETGNPKQILFTVTDGEIYLTMI